MTVGEPGPAAATSTRRPLIIAIVSLLGATLFWASNYIIGEAVLKTMDPLSLVLWRWLLAVVPLIAIAAAVFLGQRLTASGIVGVLIALVGVVVVLGGGDPAALATTGFGAGQLLMLGAVTIWTAYTIIGRRAPKLPPITSTAVQAVLTILMVAPATLVTGGPQLPVSGAAVTSLVLIAVFPSVLSYLLWNRALTVIPAARAGVFLNLITVFTVAFTIIAGQPFSTGQLLGGAIVIVGVAVANARAFRSS